MNRKPKLLAAFLVLVLTLALTACGAGGDRVERFAEAKPGSGENIAIPGYEKLTFTAGKTAQTVNLKNPAENACTFVLTLTLEGGETLWTGEALSPARRCLPVSTLEREAGRGRVPRNAPFRLLYHRGQSTAQRSGDPTDD